MLNKAQLIGRLGQDPEMRTTNSGDQIANVSLATSESWKDKDGQKQERTEWHRVVVFGKLAEIVGKYLTKGSLVFFEGKIVTRKWQDKNGQDKYTTEIQVDSFSGSMKMLSSNTNSSKEQPASSSNAAYDDSDIPF